MCMGNGVISPLQMDEWTGRGQLWSTTNCFANTSRPHKKWICLSQSLDMFLRIAFFVHQKDGSHIVVHSFGRQLSLVIHLERHNNNLSLLDYVSPNSCYPNDMFLRMHNLYMSCCVFLMKLQASSDCLDRSSQWLALTSWKQQPLITWVRQNS